MPNGKKRAIGHEQDEFPRKHSDVDEAWPVSRRKETDERQGSGQSAAEWSCRWNKAWTGTRNVDKSRSPEEKWQRSSTRGEPSGNGKDLLQRAALDDVKHGKDLGGLGVSRLGI